MYERKTKLIRLQMWNIKLLINYKCQTREAKSCALTVSVYKD